MSCNNFKFIQYPNLTKKIVDKFANNILERTELLSSIKDWIREDNIR